MHKKNQYVHLLLAIFLVSIIFTNFTSKAFAENTSALVTSSNNDNSIITHQENTNKDNFAQYDQYVQVQDGKFVFTLPKGIYISFEDLTQIQQMIQSANLLLIENNAKANEVTKSANIMIPIPSFKSAGVNSFSVHWNYVRIKLNANTTRTLLTVGSGATIAAIGVIPGNGIGTAALLGGVGAYLGLKASEVKNGIWFDYNFLMNKYTKWGWQ